MIHIKAITYSVTLEGVASLVLWRSDSSDKLYTPVVSLHPLQPGAPVGIRYESRTLYYDGHKEWQMGETLERGFEIEIEPLDPKNRNGAYVRLTAVRNAPQTRTDLYELAQSYPEFKPKEKSTMAIKPGAPVAPPKNTAPGKSPISELDMFRAKVQAAMRGNAEIQPELTPANELEWLEYVTEYPTFEKAFEGENGNVAPVVAMFAMWSQKIADQEAETEAKNAEFKKGYEDDAPAAASGYTPLVAPTRRGQQKQEVVWPQLDTITGGEAAVTIFIRSPKDAALDVSCTIRGANGPIAWAAFDAAYAEMVNRGLAPVLEEIVGQQNETQNIDYLVWSWNAAKGKNYLNMHFWNKKEDKPSEFAKFSIPEGTFNMKFFERVGLPEIPREGTRVRLEVLWHYGAVIEGSTNAQTKEPNRYKNIAAVKNLDNGKVCSLDDLNRERDAEEAAAKAKGK